MAVQLFNYITPRPATTEMDWAPLRDLVSQFRDYQQSEEAARMIQQLYGQQAQQQAALPPQQPAAMPPQPPMAAPPVMAQGGGMRVPVSQPMEVNPRDFNAIDAAAGQPLEFNPGARNPIDAQASGTPGPASPPAPATAMAAPSNEGLDRALSVIKAKESSGRYDNVTTTRNRAGQPQSAIGAYGVMDFNVGPWTKAVLGREMTPEEFRANPAAQDAVARAKLGEYAQKYGLTGAAKAWFAGEGGMNNPGARDALGTSVAGYANDFERKMGLPAEITQGASRGATAPSQATAFSETASRAIGNLSSGQPAKVADISGEQLAALYRNPQTRALATAFLQKRMTPDKYDFKVVGDKLVRTDDSGRMEVVMDVSKPMVVGNKIYDPATKTFASADDDAYPDKPSSGFRWVDPKDKSKGEIAIEGGPATQVPAEVGAKMGLAQGYLERLPAIKTALESGALGIDTATTAHLAAVAGVGPGANIKRQIDSGADALLRMLTGAGMGIQEATDYANRYRVTARDTNGQLLAKAKGLEDELHAASGGIYRGRGTNPLEAVPRAFGAPASAPVVASDAAPAAGIPVRISSDAEYEKLAPKTLFVGPDGKTRRKP